MYQVIAKWAILPGKEDDAIIALKRLASDVQKNEIGTLLYMVFMPDLTQKSLPAPAPNEVVFFEIYKDFDAFLTHINGDIFKNFVEDYGLLFLRDFSISPQIFMTTEVLTKLGGFAREGL